jgi:adenylate cyclase
MSGLHFWLRVRPWYARLQQVAFVVAVLVPVLSLLGAIEAGRRSSLWRPIRTGRARPSRE